jgi:hypothetical protein
MYENSACFIDVLWLRPPAYRLQTKLMYLKVQPHCLVETCAC